MQKSEIEKLRNIPVEGVAERLGLRVRRHMSLCPFHDDHHASLHFSVRSNTFYCFVCGAKGGVIDLVMHHLRLTFVEACRWLADANNIILEEYRPTPVAPPPPFDASRYERFFSRPFLNAEAQTFLFAERKLDARVVRWCRLTSWRDKEGNPWLQIPYYDAEGHLVGVQNRNLTPGTQPRFRFPSGAQCSIYNMPIVCRLREGDELYITEGCSDCWAMLSSGRKAIAIPSATLLKDGDRALLKALDSRGITFHMYPDNDVPGERLFLQLREVLPGLIHHRLPPGHKDFSEYFAKGNHKHTIPNP